MTTDAETLVQLQTAAQEAYKNAYAPYSTFCVGTAILLDDGSVYTGCNVENASYGLTLCAERTAVVKAVSERGKIRISAIAIANNQDMKSAPCGACRQVLAEFSDAETEVIYPSGTGQNTIKLIDLLPDAFELE